MPGVPPAVAPDLAWEGEIPMVEQARILDLDPSRVSSKATFDRKKIDKSKAYDGYLMVTIEADEEDVDRTPVNAVMVLDVSASMEGPTEAGESKLEAVKKVASRLVQNLTKQDEIAIVTYSTGVDVVLEGINGGDKAQILEAISAIRTQNSTNLSGGLLEGMRQINKAFEGVRRVMLLSDGLANHGVTDRDGLVDLVKTRDANCSISTFAFGIDADQELMADIAKAGEGNFYYISGSKDISDVFARELGGIVSCAAQNIEVTIKPNKGNEILEVLNDFSVKEKDGEAVINAEDIYLGETKNILVKMRIGKPKNVKDRPYSVAHVDVAFDDLKTKQRVKKNHNSKVKFVVASDADEERVLAVEEQIAVLEAAKAQLEAVELANARNFTGARRVLRSARKRLVGSKRRGSKMGASAVKLMDCSIEDFKENVYNSSIGSAYSSSSSSASTSRSSSSTTGGMSNLYGTSAQDDMIKKFAEVGPGGTAPDPDELADMAKSYTPVDDIAGQPNAWGIPGQNPIIFGQPSKPGLNLPALAESLKSKKPSVKKPKQAKAKKKGFTKKRSKR